MVNYKIAILYTLFWNLKKLKIGWNLCFIIIIGLINSKLILSAVWNIMKCSR